MSNQLNVKHLSQPAILAPVPACGRSLSYRLTFGSDPRPALLRLGDAFEPAWGIIGLGAPLLGALGCALPGLRGFPALCGPGIAVPSTQQALWVFLAAGERGTIFERGERLAALLGGAFQLEDAVDTFKYGDGRDLTGYLDGTANPRAEEAVAAALVAEGDGLAGASFAAVQRWVHDLPRFHSHSRAECDAMIGRRHADNEEIEDAPASAHVKRTAQELFDPPSFVLRRSMPFAGAQQQGLEFIAYGASLDPFERQLRRMAGLDDGITDALFRFSRPVTGGYYWCPPIRGDRLDLRRLGL
jgi:putative iron-dependent peroxidase